MGIVSFPLGKNVGVLKGIDGIKSIFLCSFTEPFYKRVCFASLLAEAFKKSIQWAAPFIRKCHMTFLSAASGSPRIPGRDGYLSSILL